MAARVWIQSCFLAGISSSALYVSRVWRVCPGSRLAQGMLLSVCLTSVMAGAAILARRRARRPRLAMVLAALGALLAVSATAVDFSTGHSAVVRMTPGRTAGVGNARLTMIGFEARYREDGAPEEWVSSLVVESGQKAETVAVASGQARDLKGLKVLQLGFGLEDSPEGEEIYSRIGVLEQKAGLAFAGGLGFLAAGSVISFLAGRHPEVSGTERAETGRVASTSSV